MIVKAKDKTLGCRIFEGEIKNGYFYSWKMFDRNIKNDEYIFSMGKVDVIEDTYERQANSAFSDLFVNARFLEILKIECDRNKDVINLFETVANMIFSNCDNEEIRIIKSLVSTFGNYFYKPGDIYNAIKEYEDVPMLLLNL